MATVSLTGDDTIIIGPVGAGIPIVDGANDDVCTLVHPNELASVSVGKNGNAIFANNAMGSIGDVTLRIIRASRTDRLFNGYLQAQRRDFSAFVLLAGVLVKRAGNGLGFVANDTYLLSGGVFINNVDATSNVAGDVNQSVSVYRMRFASVVRAIQ